MKPVRQPNPKLRRTELAAALGATLAATAGCASTNALVTYEAPPGLTASPLYSVTANGKPVFVYPCEVGTITDETGALRPDRHQLMQTSPAAFCYFDMTGPVALEVTVLGPPLNLPLKSALVRPLRHKIDPEIKGNTLRFSLDQPGKVSVEPNGSVAAPLLVFANPMEEHRPSPDDPNVVYFPPGVHELGAHKQVKSNTTVYIAGGAVVYGQMDNRDLSNVKVLGRGILDSSRCTLGGRQMDWFKCQDITIDGIVMLDSPSWGIAIRHCDRFTVRNVKIITGRGADAIDVCSSEDVTVDDCFARTHDDTFNVKGLTDLAFGYPADQKGHWLPTGNRKAARRIRFTNCVVWNDRAHALMMGPETRATEISDVLYRDIDIIHALSVDTIGIFSGDAAPISNVRYENLRIEDSRTMYMFEIRVNPAYTTADAECGPVRNVTFKNVDILLPGPFTTLCADKNLIDGVTFDNVRSGGNLVTDAPAGKILTRGSVTNVTFRNGP